MLHKYDYIIVGGGICGSILAHVLSKKYNILLIDNDLHRASSKVAAGIYNPLTGMRTAKTWLSDIVFPHAISYYSQFEHDYRVKIQYILPIYTPFAQMHEMNTWVAKCTDSEYAHYVSLTNDNKYNGLINDTKYGGMLIHKAGYIDVLLYIETVKQLLTKNGQYISQKIDYKYINIYQNECVLNDSFIGKVIFCEGWQGADNPYFAYLPWQLSKGELVDIKSDALHNDVIIKKSVWICPTPEMGTYKVGSTFAWNQLDNTPTEASKVALQQKINTFYPFEYKIINQSAEIRPTVKHRRPFVGMLNSHKCIGIFNGFGTKSVSLAPYFADMFCSHLSAGTTLLSDVDVNQHLKG
ncbi:MAG: FAD-dependent oxidoreductase [Cytophagales bacterium]|nr:FAD-dependent oxidoreductase [Cytophagales bacterium]